MEFVGSLFFKLEAYFLNVCRLLSGSWCSRAWLFWMAELGFDRLRCMTVSFARNLLAQKHSF